VEVDCGKEEDMDVRTSRGGCNIVCQEVPKSSLTIWMTKSNGKGDGGGVNMRGELFRKKFYARRPTNDLILKKPMGGEGEPQGIRIENPVENCKETLKGRIV